MQGFYNSLLPGTSVTNGEFVSTFSGLNCSGKYRSLEFKYLQMIT